MSNQNTTPRADWVEVMGQEKAQEVTELFNHFSYLEKQMQIRVDELNNAMSAFTGLIVNLFDENLVKYWGKK